MWCLFIIWFAYNYISTIDWKILVCYRLLPGYLSEFNKTFRKETLDETTDRMSSNLTFLTFFQSQLTKSFKIYKLVLFPTLLTTITCKSENWTHLGIIIINYWLRVLSAPDLWRNLRSERNSSRRENVNKCIVGW